MKRAFSFIHSRVARQIFILFVLCALLPVCVLALVSMQRVSARLEVDSHERLRQVAKNAGMAILGGMNLLQAELESISVPSGGGVRRISRQGGRSVGGKRFRTVTLMRDDAGDGTIPGIRRRLSPAAYAHLASGNALILADTDLGAGEPMHMVTSANPNLPQHDLLVVEINRDNQWSMVESSLSAGIDICVLGPSGKTLYSSRPLAPALVALVMSKQNGTSAGELKWQGENEEYLVNYWPVFMKPAFLADSWTVVAVQSRRDSQGPARSFLTTFVLVVLLTLFVVIFVSSLFIRRSLVPLSILKDGAQRLSRGNFESRVEIASGDEFEDLAVSFNDMAEQLGMQFTRLSEMGRLVQRILVAHDRYTIIDAVMSRFRNSVSCEWLGISLADENSPFQILTSYNNGSNGVMAETVRFETLLSEEELETLLASPESLHVRAAHGFVALLAPMVAEGGRDFFLLPIFTEDRFLGLLILGYSRAPELIREELARSRQVADEIALSLDNVRLIDELNWLNRGTIEVLANAVDAKSPWTAGHSKRVTRLALEIGKEMGLSGNDLEQLQLGGLFHDMGKIGVPESILDKPDRLTEEEYAIIKKHPEKGAEMLEPIRAYHGAIPIVAQHHEQFGGQGYPLGLVGEEIALGARILAVADVFDALYSNRPYRQGWELGRVVSYLVEKGGSDFDPEVVKAFLKIDRSAYLEASDDAARPELNIDACFYAREEERERVDFEPSYR